MSFSSSSSSLRCAGMPDRALLEHLRLERQLLTLERQYLRQLLKVPETVSVKVNTARESDTATERTLLARYVEALKTQKSVLKGKTVPITTCGGAAASPAVRPSKPSSKPMRHAALAAGAEESCQRLEAEVAQRLEETLRRRQELEELLQSLKGVVRGFLQSIQLSNPHS